MHINKNFQLNLSSIAYGGLVVAMFIVLAMSCNTSVGSTEGDKNIDEAIEMLEYVFEGTYNKRIIRPFCGPPCANKYREMSDVNDYPQRKPLPHGPEWQIIQNIDNIKYETD